MKLLLDSHAILWWALNNQRLSLLARQAIANPDNQVFISTASLWEMSIKYNAGKLPEYTALGRNAESILEQHGFFVLPIFYKQAFAASQLPMHHHDPFDRILIATATMENMYLVSMDAALHKYEVQILW